jgi:hypothetical protein
MGENVANPQQPDVFWTMVDWAVRGAGAVIAFVLAMGWKDWRTGMRKVTDLEIQMAELRADIKNLKERRHE